MPGGMERSVCREKTNWRAEPAASLLPPLDGLVWGYRFDDDGHADPLDGAAAMLELERQGKLGVAYTST